MQKFTITLTPEQLNLIGMALGKMPYETIFSLMAELTKQVNEQSNNSDG
jgi:hypothetical protein